MKKFLYVTKASKDKKYVKIGKTNDPRGRLISLNGTSTFYPYEFLAIVKCNADEEERRIKEEYSDRRISTKKEFYSFTNTEALEIFSKIGENIVRSFTEPTVSAEGETFYLKGKDGANGIMTIEDGKCILKKGSILRLEEAPSLRENHPEISTKRDLILKKLTNRKGKLLHDVVFPKSTLAAGVVTGNCGSGLTLWKTADNQPLRNFL